MWFLIIFIAIIIGFLYNKYKDNNNSTNNSKTENIVSNENILFELIEKDNLNAFIHWYENKSTYSNIKLNYEGFDLLIYAIELNRPDFVKYLIETGDYNLNKLYTDTNKYGVFPLAQAVTNGCTEIVKILLDSEDIIPGLYNKGFANIETFALVTLRGDQFNKQSISKMEIDKILDCVELALSDARFEKNWSGHASLDLLKYAIANNRINLFKLYINMNVLDEYDVFKNHGLWILNEITSNTSQMMVKEICNYIEKKLKNLSLQSIEEIFEKFIKGAEKESDSQEKEVAYCDLNNNIKEQSLVSIKKAETIFKGLDINNEQKNRILELFTKVKKIYRKKIK